MKLSSKHAWYVAALVVVGLVVTIPVGQNEIEGDTIVLGAVLSSTGDYQTSGNHTYNGYEFAIRRINEAGGIKVQGKLYQLRLISYDDESKPPLASRLTERLIKEDGIKFMLGPYSSEMTKAVARITENYEIPLVATEAASINLYDRGYRYLFGLLSTCEQYLVGVVDIAAAKAKNAGNHPGDLSLGIIVKNDRFSLCVRKAVLEQAAKHGIKTVVNEKLPKQITDMSAALGKVRENSPDILVVSGHATGAEVTVRQMHEMQIDAPVVAITHCEAARIIEKFGSAAESIYCPAQWAPTLPDIYKDEIFGTATDFSIAMKAAYPEEYYNEIPYQAASAAAGVLVWKDAFERANSFDPEDLRVALAATDLMTFYGRIKFSPTGQINSKPMILRQIRAGKYIVLNSP